MSTTKQHTGNKGEDYACDLLLEKNFKILARNYRYGHGEIDIVAEDGDVLVFVEVKTRKNLEFGPPISAITRNKQRQVRKIAEAYLIEHNISDRDCRIDVVGVLLKGNEQAEIDHIENAF
ncbi:MAG: YraN family protein [Bacteroidota bacterium]